MKNVLTGLICLAMATGGHLLAQDAEKTKTQQKKDKNQIQAKNQKQGEQETIRGTVAGVTTIGEAVIDPQTNTAVIAEADYLTVLGTPARSQGQPGNRADRENPNRQDPSAQDTGQNRRQNLYLVAITSETKVQKAEGPRANRNQPGRSGQQDQQQSRANFAELEIGDRVMVEFAKTERLNAKADSKSDKAASKEDKADKAGEERAAGFRGDSKNKHGRNRIFVGEASQIRIMADSMNQGGQNREGRERSRRRSEADREKDQNE